MNHIKIAKELIKLAKSLVSFELIGQAYYRIMDEQANQISVNFSIQTKDRDQLLGWFDAMLGRPTEIVALAKPYGFEDLPNTMDVKNMSGTSLSICLKGNADCDMDGLIQELKSKYHCNEIK